MELRDIHQTRQPAVPGRLAARPDTPTLDLHAKRRRDDDPEHAEPAGWPYLKGTVLPVPSDRFAGAGNVGFPAFAGYGSSHAIEACPAHGGLPGLDDHLRRRSPLLVSRSAPRHRD